MIYKRLRELRKQRGLTQLDVADHLHISQSTYSHIESGQSKLDCTLIPKICELFDVKPNDIFCDCTHVYITKPELDHAIRELKEEMNKNIHDAFAEVKELVDKITGLIRVKS